MAGYQPESRRPIAGVFRRTAGSAVNLCVKINLHPNHVSLLSIVAALVAAICFYEAGTVPWLLIPAALFCYVRLWLNMLDGMVALASGQASRLGEVFNEVPDRVSDILIFAGVTCSGLCHPFLGYWVIIMAVFVAYIGMFGQAVGVKRQFGGVMAKQWRMVTLHIGTWVALGFWAVQDQFIHWQGYNLVDLTLGLILLGCLQTVIVRLRRIILALKSTPAPKTI